MGTSRSRGANPTSASTSSALRSSSSNVSGTPSNTLTTQSWHPGPRTAQSSQSIFTVPIWLSSRSVLSARYRLALTNNCASAWQPAAVGRVPYLQRMGQLSFADVDPLADVSLRETSFVVVDLETTGGRASVDGDAATTEIGAVKVRGGAVLGELATLVDPGRSIPPQIVALTGITSAMVYNAPTIDSVLPAFLEFSRGAVLVAHNAGFDIGFLRAAAERCQITWPRPPVLCTVRLARRVLTRDEAPSVRLSALARLFAAATTPTHRALDDARATVDVLHALIERVGNQGVHTYTELRAYLPDVSPEQRRKRVLAANLPRRPGVYLFRGPADEVLYVGT